MSQVRLQKTDKNATKPKKLAKKQKSKVTLQDEMAVLVCEGNKLATSGMFARAAASYTRAILASGCSNKIKGEGNCQGSYTRAILASDPGSNKTLSSLFVKRAACLARSTIFFRDHAYL